jgi:hypothetical protein
MILLRRRLFCGDVMLQKMFCYIDIFYGDVLSRICFLRVLALSLSITGGKLCAYCKFLNKYMKEKKCFVLVCAPNSSFMA